MIDSAPHVALDAIADISAGNPAPQGSKYFSVTGLPFVRMQDVGRDHINPSLVETADKITENAISECKLRLYPTGTLLIPKSGASVNLNHRAMLGAPAYVVSHLATIVPDTSRVDPTYLFHWSTGYDPRKQAQVTSLPSLPLSLIAKAQVPLPPLEEQRRIVALLDRAADIKRRAESVRAKASNTIPALFIDMFGDPVTNSKGWETIELSRAAAIASGITKGRKIRESVFFQAPYIRVANVQDGRLDLGEVKMINAVAGDLMRYKLEADDLLMTEGGDPDKLGRCAIWNNEVQDCLYQNHVFRVRVDRTQLLPAYAATLIGSAYGKSYFLKVAKQTTGIASINKTQLSAFPMLVPPIALQKEFERLARAAKILETVVESVGAKAANTQTALAAEVFA